MEKFKLLMLWVANSIITIAFIVIIALMLSGCKTKQITTTETKIDTIIKTEVVRITEPQLNEIIIDEPCDSLGRLKTFTYTNTSNKVRSTLKSDNGRLRFEINVDSIVDSKVNEFKSTYKAKEVEKIITKIKWPKLLWYSLVINILLIAWTFREKLPFKFI